MKDFNRFNLERVEMVEAMLTSKQRRIDVKALVELTVPIDVALKNLAKYPFDYIGEPFHVRSKHVSKAAAEFLNGEITADELISWANRLEMHEDVLVKGKTEQETDLIIQAIFELANPELSGCSIEDTAKHIRTSMLNNYGDASF